MFSRDKQPSKRLIIFISTMLVGFVVVGFSRLLHSMNDPILAGKVSSADLFVIVSGAIVMLGFEYRKIVKSARRAIPMMASATVPFALGFWEYSRMMLFPNPIHLVLLVSVGAAVAWGAGSMGK